MVISFLGVRTDGQTERRTDRQGFGILLWKHVGTQKISTRKLKISGQLSIPICLPGGRGCIMKSHYSFEDRGTDRQTDGIDFGMTSQRPLKWYMTRLSKLKISWWRRKQYTSPITVRGKHKNLATRDWCQMHSPPVPNNLARYQFIFIIDIFIIH